MKKITLSFLSILAILIAGLSDSNAQVRRSSFRVNNPASIAGYLITSEISDQGASPWGTGINGKWENIPVAFDQNNPDGCAAFTPGYFTGKFALIYRGGCEFGAKALAAQNAGAVGVIIVNNLLGVAGMGAGANGAQVTIPVVMVTTAAGNSIRTQLLNNVAVDVSLTAWRFDSIANPIDIGFKNDGPLFPYGKAFPKHQCSTSMGNSDDSFRVFTGGRFYNFSTATFDTINLQGRIAFNPQFVGGTFTQTDSNLITYYFNTPITTTDSILYLKLDTINNNLVGFDMNDADLGTYRMSNQVVALPFTETVSAQMDNVWEYNFAVTDSVYSKCSYDFSKNSPVANFYVNIAAASNYYWGPVYYIRNGGHLAQKGQVVVMRDVIDDSVFTGSEVTLTLWKWDDANGNNNIDMPGEVEEVTNGTYVMTANDIVPIGGKTVTVDFVTNILNPGQPIIMEANTRYWLTLSFNGANTYAVGSDYYADYAANLAWNVSRGNPLYDITGNTMYGGGFSEAGSPSIALHMSKLPVGTNDIVKFDGNASVYPNPASTEVNVSLELNNLSKKVTYEIVDVTGKTISSYTKNNVTTDVYNFNTSKLANGSYFIKISTDNGNTQLKFIVAK